MSDPQKVVMAGDWHGNTEWSIAVAKLLPQLLPDESPRLIVHVGDFGIWPGVDGERYLHKLSRELRKVDGKIWFVDGNHEDYTQLVDNHKFRQVPGIDMTDVIRWMPRGEMWEWHGRRWVAAGGAVSVDRTLRRENFDWWPQEEISESDHHRIVEAGSAHGPNGLVMVCHDAPTSVPMSFGAWPQGWDIADKARADAHRDRLQAICDEIEPDHLFHGHYHRWHDLSVSMAHGDVRVVGLDMDGTPRNYALLDVETMEIEVA